LHWTLPCFSIASKRHTRSFSKHAAVNACACQAVDGASSAALADIPAASHQLARRKQWMLSSSTTRAGRADAAGCDPDGKMIRAKLAALPRCVDGQHRPNQQARQHVLAEPPRSDMKMSMSYFRRKAAASYGSARSSVAPHPGRKRRSSDRGRGSKREPSRRGRAWIDFGSLMCRRAYHSHRDRKR
jgi:hypothetical protein